MFLKEHLLLATKLAADWCRARALPGVSFPVERECYSAELNSPATAALFDAADGTDHFDDDAFRVDHSLALARSVPGTVDNIMRVNPSALAMEGRVGNLLGLFRARMVVAADGANSSVARQADGAR